MMSEEEILAGHKPKDGKESEAWLWRDTIEKSLQQSSSLWFWQSEAKRAEWATRNSAMIHYIGCLDLKGSQMQAVPPRWLAPW